MNVCMYECMNDLHEIHLLLDEIRVNFTIVDTHAHHFSASNFVQDNSTTVCQAGHAVHRPLLC